MLESPRANLYLLIESDFSELLEMYHEPDTFKYIKHLQNLSDEAYRNFLNKKSAQIKTKEGYYWVARHREGGEMIGAMNLNPLPNTNYVQLGFQLRRKFWNQGYATELAKRILQFGIEDWGLEIIYGIFEKENIASGKILRGLGFVPYDKKILAEEVEVYAYENNYSNPESRRS